LSTATASVRMPSTGITNARLGVWWFMGGELLIFGGLLACYVLMRLRHPEWAEHAEHTIGYIGFGNTLVLLTSSLTIVSAFKAADNGQFKKSANLCWVTVGLGVLFLAVKSFEYSHEIHAGFTPTTNLFWSFYFLMTGLHALHIIGGLIAIGIIAKGVAKGRNPQRVELVGLYWHLVDIIWIFLFPLVYVAS